MAGNDDLRILIKTELEKASFDNIQKQLDELKKKYESSGIKIKISDETAKVLQDFSKSMDKVQSILKEQRRTVEETQTVFKELDGSVKTVTQKIDAMGEVVTKTRIIHDANKKAMQDETIAAQKLAEGMEKLKNAELDRIKINQNKAGNTTGYTITQSDGIKQTQTRLESDGQTLVGRTIIYDYKKAREENDKLKQGVEELRVKLQELAQVGVLSKQQLSDVAKLTNSSKNLGDLEEAKKKYSDLLAIQQEILNVRSAQLKVDTNNEKQLEKEKQKTAELEHQLTLYKQQAEINVKNAQRRFGDKIDSADLQEYLDKVRKLTVDTPNLKNEMDKLAMSFKEISAEANTSGSHVMGFGEQLKVAMSRVPIWLVATTAIFGTKRVLEDMIGTVVQLDTQMVELKRVMDSDTNFDQMMKGSIVIANELGQKVTDINKALIDAAQAGFKAQEALDITKTAVIASNVSDMTPEESMNNIIAAMKAFNIEASNSIEIVDKLNQVDNDYSITTKNLADAVTHAGAAAQTYGVTIDQLIGYTTAIGEVTRESGNVIGNMEKTLFSRLYTKESIDVLNQVKIATTDINGENRKASDILNDIGEKWKTLTSTQQENIGVTLAGRQQLTRFLALFNNWDTAVAATKTSMDSQGSAMRENQKYMESLQAKINLLSTAWEQLANTVGGVGLKGLFSGVVETLTTLTRGFTEFTNATDGWNIKLPIFAAGLYGLVKAFQAVKIAAEGAKLSMGWLGIGLVAIDLLASVFIGAAKNTEINTQALIDNANQTKSNADQIQNLIDRYNELEPQAKNNAEKQKELQGVLQQINDIAPQLIDKTNKYGDSLNLNKEKANAYIASLREMTKEQLEQAKLANQIQLNKVSSDLEAANNKLQKFGEDVSKKFDQLDVFQNLFKAKTIEQGLENYRKMIQDLEAERDKALQSGDTVSFNKLDGQINELKQKFMAFADLTKNSQKELAEYSQTVNERNGLIQQKKVLDEQSKSIQDQIEGRNKLGNAIKSNQLQVDEETGEIIKAAGFQEVLGQKFTETVEKIRPLNDAIDKLKQGHQLSSSEISNLLKQYPDLFNAFTVENGHLQINIKALEDKRQAEIADMQTSISSQQEQVKAQEQALVAKLKAYGVEIDAINSVAEAKKAVASAINNVDANTNMSEFQQIGELNKITNDLEPQLETIAKAKESLNALQQAAKTGFSFQDTLNTPKPKKEPTPFDETENYKNNPYQRASKDLEAAIKASESIMTRYNDTSKEYRDELQKQYELHIKQRDLQRDEAARIRDENRALQARLDTEKLSTKQRNDLLKQLEDNKNTLADLSEKWWDYELAASESQKKITESVQKESKAQFDASKKWIEDQKALNKLSLDEELAAWERVQARYLQGTDERIEADKEVARVQEELAKQREENEKKRVDNAKEVAKQVADAYKAVYEAQKQAELDTIQAQMDAEEKRHKQVTDNLDAELKKYEDSINTITQSIDRQDETDTYNEDLAKKQKDAQDIQDQINKYKLDTSIEGQAKLKELEQQYVNKQEEIQKLQKDRTKTLRKESLQDLLDQKKKEIDAAKQSEDAQYNATKDSLEKQKSEREKYWQGVINDDSKYQQIQDDIIAGHFDNIKSEMEGFKTDIASKAAIIGAEIDKNIINKINSVQSLMSNYQSNPLGDINNNFSSGTSTSGYYVAQNSNEQHVIDMMKQNSQKWFTDTSNRSAYEQANREWAKQIGATYKNGTWYKNGLPLYHDGGEVGVQGTSFAKWWNLKSDEVAAILKKGEIVMNNPLQNIASMVSKFIPDFSKIKPVVAGSGGDTHYNFDIRIDKLMGGEEGANELFKRFKVGLQTGRYK
jgi:TP901 family phage tail tape measure protein